MRLTTHRIVKEVPKEGLWSRLKLENTIFLNAPTEFIWYIQNEFNTNDTYTQVSEMYIYYNRGSSSNNISQGSCVIVHKDSMDKFDLMEVEARLINGVIGDDLIEGGAECRAFYNSLGQNYISMKNAEKALIKHRESLASKADKVVNTTTAYQNMKSRYSQLKRINMLSGIKNFVFEDVIAEDVDANGEDINLGRLEFKVNFLEGSVEIVSGTHVRHTGFNDRSVHPHQMSNSICLGTQEPDFNIAVRNWEISIVEAILYKFAHSYASSDGAGRNYVLWTQDLVYVDYINRNAPRTDTVFSEHSQSYVLVSDAVELSNGQWAHKGHCRFSEFQQVWMLEQDAVYSEVLNSYIDGSSVVQLENGRGYVPANFEFMSMYRRRYFHHDDTVELHDGSRVPERNAVRSQYLDNKYILTSEAVQYEGNWYRQQDLDTYLTSLAEGTPASTEEAPATVEETETVAPEPGSPDELMARILEDGGSISDVYRAIVG